MVALNMKKDMTMAHWFEDFIKTMASECPSGFFCSGYNGCTNCMGGPVTAGVCLHYCQKICPSIDHSGLTAAGCAH
jgi:hypothetical protein